MTTIASRVADRLGPLRSALRFIAVRSGRSALVAAVVLGGLTAWFGSREASVPAALSEGTAVVPLWRMLGMGAAVLPILALHSRMADLETVATRKLRASQRLYLSGMGLGCASVYFGISATSLHPTVLLIMGRSWLAWTGLALVAGALWGWRLAWTLPAAVSVTLTYWGYQGDQRYRWWEFSARPHDDLPSLILSSALLAAGLAAYWATPWRRRRVRAP